MVTRVPLAAAGANRRGRGSTAELVGERWAFPGDMRPSFSARGVPTSPYRWTISIVGFRCMPTHIEGRTTDRLLTYGGAFNARSSRRAVNPASSRDPSRPKGDGDLLLGQLGGYLARGPIPIVGNVDLDNLLFVVGAGRAVRTATTEGDAFSRGGSWGVAWRCAVEDETAFHGWREQEGEQASEARGTIEGDAEEERSGGNVV